MKKARRLKEWGSLLKEIRQQLEWDEQTQCTPSEELIAQLNKKASSPHSAEYINRKTEISDDTNHLWKIFPSAIHVKWENDK